MMNQSSSTPDTPITGSEAVAAALIERLEAVIASERAYSDQQSQDYGVAKLVGIGCAAIEEALSQCRRELESGTLSVKDFPLRMLARLDSALESHEHYWDDEDGYGTSTIKRGIYAVEHFTGRRD